jgi:hypothetical protein
VRPRGADRRVRSARTNEPLMTDSHLRDLERRFRQSGSPDDSAAYLLERVRVGDLAQERLDLAAYCGHEGASVAVGLIPRRPPITDVVAHLTHRDRPTAVVGLLEALGQAGIPDELVAPLRAVCLTWASDPTVANADECSGVIRTAIGAIMQAGYGDHPARIALVNVMLTPRADEVRGPEHLRLACLQTVSLLLGEHAREGMIAWALR